MIREKNVQSAQVAKFRPNSPKVAKVAKDNNFIAKKKLTTFSLTQKRRTNEPSAKDKKIKGGS